MAIPPGFSGVVGLGMGREMALTATTDGRPSTTDDEGGIEREREKQGDDETLALRAPSVPVFIPKQVELPREHYGIPRQCYLQLTLRLWTRRCVKVLNSWKICRRDQSSVAKNYFSH